jgi:hypothetical protein
MVLFGAQKHREMNGYWSYKCFNWIKFLGFTFLSAISFDLGVNAIRQNIANLQEHISSIIDLQ